MIRRVLLTCLLLLAPNTGHSKEVSSDDQVVIIAGKEYKKSEIIEDFLRVAFSDIPWNADAGEEDQKKIFDSYFPEGQSAVKDKDTDTSSWYSKHKHYVGKGPLYKRNVINKWEREEITIGFFLPYSSRINEKMATEHNEHNMKHYRYSFEKIMKDGREKIISNAVSVIEKQLPALSKVIGKEISIIHPRDVWDSTSEYARIRVIPDGNMGYRTWLQVSDEKFPNAIEESFLNGVLFQSYTRRYFDGYLLPDSSHEIDMSICKVDPQLDVIFYTALLNECLVRTLGMSGMSVSSDSVLSHWHTKPESLLKYSAWFKIGERFADPVGEEGKLKSANMLENAAKTYNDPKKLEQAKAMKKAYENEKREILDEHQLNYFSTITPYDKFMLRILYCSNIKSGMSPSEVREVLSTNESCFKTN
jgi:hypothetical protein